MERQQQGADSGDVPAGLGLTAAEYEQLRPTVDAHHRYAVGAGQCSSLLAQRIQAPPAAVWAIVRRFDCPQVYKHFIRSCVLRPDPDAGDDALRPGRLREVSVISGLPASTSTERLDLLDDAARVFGFSITGGEHRLRNYRSVTTVSEVAAAGGPGGICTVVLESYVVDVPEGNTEDDTRLFADTVIRLNLQKLKSIAEANANAAAAAAAAPTPPAK